MDGSAAKITTPRDGLPWIRVLPEWLDELPKAARRVWKAVETFFRTNPTIQVPDRNVGREAKMGRRNVQKGWLQLERAGYIERRHVHDEGRLIDLKFSFATAKKEEKTRPAKPPDPAARASKSPGPWAEIPPPLKEQVHSANDELRRNFLAVESWEGEDPVIRALPGRPTDAARPDRQILGDLRQIRALYRAWIAAGRPARE